MIRINKSDIVPAILSGRGVEETAELEAAYSANPVIYTSAPIVSNKTLTRFEFDSAIYGDDTVKNQLIADQHGKCCFCEAIFSDNSYGDVEHFRPKTAYKKFNAQTLAYSRTLTYPGYYWLAYNWSNLMFSCEKCNRSFKRNKFPLDNESTRKPFHNHPNDIVNEDCLLINPNIEDPTIDITFKEEVPVPVNGSLKGQTTIEAFNLYRMNNSRLEHLISLKRVMALVQINTDSNVEVELAMRMFKFSRKDVIEIVSEANLAFNKAAKDTAEFAYCVRCKFPEMPIVD